MAMNSKEISDTINKKRGYTGEAGSMDAESLQSEFGLESGNSTPSDSSTGSKSNDQLGEGYLSDSDTKRLLGNEKLKQAFIDSGGDPDSWETSNDVDTALDYLTMAKEEEAPAPEPELDPGPIQQSEELSSAKAGVKAYEDVILPRTGDIITGRYSNYQDDYLKSYKLNLAQEMEPKNADGTPRESKIQEEKDKVAGQASF